MEEEKTEEQTEEQIKDVSWLAKELEEVKETSFDGERKPALKLEENKITKMIIDFSNPFEVWKDVENNSVKKIIPVKVGAVDFVWWLNVKNPIYHKIIELGADGKTEFKVLQTGTQKNTKYTLVEE